MLNLEAVRCFCTVVEAEGFAAAAQRLHRTQPAVSQRIRSLEASLGSSLLDRSANTPTPAGRVLYEEGRRLLRASDDLEREVRAVIDGSSGEVRIGAGDTNALYFLPAKVRAFAKRMPSVRLRIHCRSSGQVADEVERGELDVGIVTLPLHRPTLETRPLFAQRLVLIVPKTHRLGGRTRVQLDQLSEEPFILIHESTRTGAQLRRYFVDQGFTPNVTMDSGSFEVITSYVAEGLGISIVPEITLRKSTASQLAKVRIPGLPNVEIGAIWRRTAYQPPAVIRFRELLLGAST